MGTFRTRRCHGTDSVILSKHNGDRNTPSEFCVRCRKSVLEPQVCITIYYYHKKDGITSMYIGVQTITYRAPRIEKHYNLFLNLANTKNHHIYGVSGGLCSFLFY